MALVFSACGVWTGLGEKEERADAIREAVTLARQQGGATTVLTFSVTSIDTILREPPEPLLARLEGAVRFSDSIDEPTGRPDAAVLDIREPEDFEGALVYDDFALLLPRDPDRGGLPWATYDFDVEPEEDFDVEDRRLSVGFAPFSPTILIQFLEGVLTGSVEAADRVVDEAGMAVYTANFSNDAALRDLDEFRRDSILRMFEAIGVGGEVFGGEVWIDSQGLPRRIQYVMEQRQDRLNLFETTITLELTGFGVPDELALPPADQRQAAERYSEMIVEFLRRA